MIDDNIYLSNFSVISYLGHFLKKTMKVKKGTMNNTLSNMRTETQTHSALQEISYLITTTAAQLEQRPAMLQEFPSIVYCLSQCCSSFWWIFKLNKGWEKEYRSGINGLFSHTTTPRRWASGHSQTGSAELMSLPTWFIIQSACGFD